jgi:hemolysin activation/secretion protein
VRYYRLIAAVLPGALAVLALLSLPAAAQVVPGAADVSRVQSTLQNGGGPPQPPQAAAPLEARPNVLPEEEAVPENADSLKFALQGVTLDGNTVYKNGELDALWQADLGHTVSLKRIYDLASAITAKFRADGYFLSSAYVPAQKIHNGTPHITIVEGYIENVEFTGEMPQSRLLEDVRQHLLKLGPLNVRALERQMLLLNDFPGTHFRALLKPVKMETPAQAAEPPVVISSTRDDPDSPGARRAAGLGPGGSMKQLGRGPPLAPDTLSVDVAAQVSAQGNVVFFSPRDELRGPLAAKLNEQGAKTQNTQVVELGHRDEGAGSEVGTKLGELGNVELVVVDPVDAASIGPIAQAAAAHNVPAMAVAQSLSSDDWLKAAAPAPAVLKPTEPPPAPQAPEGAVVLEINGAPAPRVHGLASLDNTGSRFIGPWTAGLQLSLDRGLPDYQQAILTLNGTVPDRELKSVLGRYVIPLTADGLKVSVNGGYTKGRPGYTLTPDDLNAISKTAGAEVDWDWLRQRTENVRLSAGLDYLDSDTTLLGAPFQHDRISAARLGGHFDEQDRFNGSTIVDGTLKKGLEILGASHAGDKDLSRAGGRPDFASLSSTVYRFQNVSANWNALLGATGQIADSQLLSSQQFGYGGQSFGRAYDTSEFVGDEGVAAMTELRYDGFKPMGSVHLEPFGFYDVGHVWNRGAGPSSSQAGASTGLGLRLNGPAGLTSALTVTEPLTARLSDPPYGDGKSPRVLLTIGAPFTLGGP